MLLKRYCSQLLNNDFYFLLIAIIFFTSTMSAQNDTLFFDLNWKKCKKETALYYRIKPTKIKTKDAVGYKIKDLDSLYVINDYFIKNNKLQFQGHSVDTEAQYLVGNAIWYNENNNKTESNNFNYKNNNENSKFTIPEWPILYLGYSIASKSQFTGGLEFCLDCKNESKLFLGLGYGISNYDGNYFGLPDAHLSYNSKKSFFFKAGASNKNAYTMTGLTFLNVIDLGFGYSFPFEQDRIPEIKGFTFGIIFRITKNKNAINSLKIGF